MKRILLAGAMLASPQLPALAQELPTPELAAMQAEIEAQRARIAELERIVAQLAATRGMGVDQIAPPAAGPATTAPATLITEPAARNPFRLSGDLRVRVEYNALEGPTPDRARGALRARLAADVAVSDWLDAGVRLVTGDGDDPNTADVTLSNFLDDVPVNLDRVFLSATRGSLTASAGKFALPFRASDLVWDGDVSPQGVAVSFAPTGALGRLQATGLFTVIDENAAGPDSTMTGGQIYWRTPAGQPSSFGLAVAYLDYDLSHVANAQAGDFRSNRLGPNGDYLSDFNLLDIMGEARFPGLYDHWPIDLTAEYVVNDGAAGGAEAGFSLQAASGLANGENRWNFQAGYMHTETDAVFAAFSHDNFDLATNYRAYTLGADFWLDERTGLNAQIYRYRDLHGLPNAPRDWRTRIRLNLVTKF